MLFFSLSRYMKSTAVEVACTVGHEGCIKKAKEEFEKWLINEDYKYIY